MAEALMLKPVKVQPEVVNWPWVQVQEILPVVLFLWFRVRVLLAYQELYRLSLRLVRHLEMCGLRLVRLKWESQGILSFPLAILREVTLVPLASQREQAPWARQGPSIS